MTESLKKVGTHNGTFHCDEVMGCMLLTNYTNDYKNCPITRSRDKSVLDTLDIVIDVGGEYNHETHRYDHHQSGFNEFFSEKHTIKLSASGLVYKHFGQEIIRNALEDLFATNKIKDQSLKASITDEAVSHLTLKLYDGFFVTIDAIDNGIDQYPKEVEPKYRFYHTDLASRIGRSNPTPWDQCDNSEWDKRFHQAMNVCKEEFLDALIGKFMGTYWSKSIMQAAFDKRLEIHESGQIVLLPQSCFWKEPLFAIEEENKLEGLVKYVIYTDSASGKYRIQSAPESLGSFASRCPLHVDWRGKPIDELRKLTGLDDAEFCHHSGFIGGATSLESTIKMALMSLPKS